MKKYSKEWWQSLKPEVVGKETERLVEQLLDEENIKEILVKIFSGEVAEVA